MSPRAAVFCDFDGTITAVETFAGMLKVFAPQIAAEVMPQLYARSVTLREGVRRMLEAIPASQYEAVIGFADDKPIRAGLPELIAFCQGHGIPFHVVSGGLRGMVERVLQREGITGISSLSAVDVAATEGFLRVPTQAFEGGTELIAKVQVMERYPAALKIAIGDSVTDVNMAFHADLVFARDRLIDYMQAEGKPYVTWDTFFEIRDFLASHLKG
jgi:2-hydroxy-3-keto-5-methylthiopentenyl-1-phosphate phosphatase